MDITPDPFNVEVNLRRELIRAGWHDRGIAEQVKRGRWVRLRHGAYTDAQAWRSFDARGRHVVMTRAVVKAAATSVIVSHESGVAWLNGPTWGLDLSNVSTTRRDGKTGRREAGVHQHCGVLIDGDVELVNGVEVMAPARLALEVSTRTSLETAVVVLNDFLHRQLTSPAAVRARYEATMERWPGGRRTDIVIRLGHPKIASVLESRFWCLCYRAGLPAPIPQYQVRTPDGHLVAELDFAWPDLGAYVETNGRAKYLELVKPGETPGQVIERERRREELVGRLTGFRAMHVSWSDMESPLLTTQRTRDHLGLLRRSVG